MALVAQAGPFTWGTDAATTTYEVNCGFTPTALLVWMSGIASDTDAQSSTLDIHWSVGAAVSTSSREATAANLEDAAASDTQAVSYAATDCLLIEPGAFQAVSGKLDLSSFDSDGTPGFTMVVDDAAAAVHRCGYLAIAGTTNAAVGQLTEPGETGDQYVDCGFEPDAVIFFSAGCATPASDEHAWPMFGFATGASNQWVCGGYAVHGGASADCNAYGIDDECIAFGGAGVTVTARASFVDTGTGESYGTAGFRINWAERAASRDVHYLALKGGLWTAGKLLTQTDDTAITGTTTGMDPVGVLFVSACRGESASDTATVDGEMSLGAATATDKRHAQSFLYEDAKNATEANVAVEHDGVYVHITNAGAVDGIMDLTALGTESFSCVMDDYDPSQAAVGWLAFGNATAGAASPSFVSRHHPRGVLRGVLRGIS